MGTNRSQYRILLNSFVPTSVPTEKTCGYNSKGVKKMAFVKEKLSKYTRTVTSQIANLPNGPFKPSRNLPAEWPEVFQLRTVPRLPTGKWDRGPLEEEALVFCDPRQDLADEDPEESWFWGWLLADALAVNKELAITLHGFRCMGTRLVRTEKGFAMKPEVSERAWLSQEEYQQARDKYLVPHQKQLVKLLKNLH